MALTPEQKKYYDDLGEMMATAGWKSLIEEAKNEIYQLQADALDVDVWEKVCWLRGKAEQLAYLINLEAISDAQRALLEEEEDVEVLE